MLCRYLIAEGATLVVFWLLTSLAGYLFPAYHEYIVRVEITGLILLIVAMLFLLIVKMVRGEWDGKSLAFIIPA